MLGHLNRIISHVHRIVEKNLIPNLCKGETALLSLLSTNLDDVLEGPYNSPESSASGLCRILVGIHRWGLKCNPVPQASLGCVVIASSHNKNQVIFSNNNTVHMIQKCKKSLYFMHYITTHYITTNVIQQCYTGKNAAFNYSELQSDEPIILSCQKIDFLAI